MPFHNSLTCICGRFHVWFWYPKTPQLTMFCIQIPFLRVPYPDFNIPILPSYSHPWLWHPTPPTATIPKYIPIIAIVRICRYYSTILGCCHSICIDAQHESSLYPIAYLYIYIYIFIYIIHTYIPNHFLWVLQSIHQFFIVLPLWWLHTTIPWCLLNHVICPPIYLVVVLMVKSCSMTMFDGYISISVG